MSSTDPIEAGSNAKAFSSPPTLSIPSPVPPPYTSPLHAYSSPVPPLHAISSSHAAILIPTLQGGEDVPNDPGKMFIGGLSWQTTPEVSSVVLILLTEGFSSLYWIC